MTEKQKEEMRPIMEAAGLGHIDIGRDKDGFEYLKLYCMAAAYVSKGDWKVNVKSALLDIVRTSQDALDKFNKAVD